MQVVAGAPLFRLEPVTDDDGAEVETERIDVTALTGSEEAPGAELIRSSLLGFDVSVERADELARSGCVHDAGDGVLGIYAAFADLCSLAPDRHEAGDEVAGGRREYFNAYLRSLDADREGVPVSARRPFSARIGMSASGQAISCAGCTD